MADELALDGHQKVMSRLHDLIPEATGSSMDASKIHQEVDFNKSRVSDGIRTRDPQDHNLVL